MQWTYTGEHTSKLLHHFKYEGHFYVLQSMPVTYGHYEWVHVTQGHIHLKHNIIIGKWCNINWRLKHIYIHMETLL
jgi:hypothetical protein